MNTCSPIFQKSGLPQSILVNIDKLSSSTFDTSSPANTLSLILPSTCATNDVRNYLLLKKLITVSHPAEGPSIYVSQLYSNQKRIGNIDHFVPVIPDANIYLVRKIDHVAWPVTFSSNCIVPGHMSKFIISFPSSSEIHTSGLASDLICSI